MKRPVSLEFLAFCCLIALLIWASNYKTHSVEIFNFGEKVGVSTVKSSPERPQKLERYLEDVPVRNNVDIDNNIIIEAHTGNNRLWVEHPLKDHDGRSPRRKSPR